MLRAHGHEEEAVLLIPQLPLQVSSDGVHALLLVLDDLVELHGQRGHFLALMFSAPFPQREAGLDVPR
eukprot:3334452-Karenia_brevis.AAC.1